MRINIKNNYMKRLIGLFIMVLGLLLALFHFGMFGFNLLPQSKEEFVYDMVDLIVVLVGIIMYKKND